MHCIDMDVNRTRYYRLSVNSFLFWFKTIFIHTMKICKPIQIFFDSYFDPVFFFHSKFSSSKRAMNGKFFKKQLIKITFLLNIFTSNVYEFRMRLIIWWLHNKIDGLDLLRFNPKKCGTIDLSCWKQYMFVCVHVSYLLSNRVTKKKMCSFHFEYWGKKIGNYFESGLQTDDNLLSVSIGILFSLSPSS